MHTEVAEFTTPHGHRARFAVRPGSNDWNVCQAITIIGDEYRMPEGLTGWGLDVGAHIGAGTVTFLLDNPEAKMVAIEALPENVALLRQNVEMNGLTHRAVVIEAAAGTGEQVRIGYGADGVHDYIGNATAPQGNREIIVQGFSLGDVLEYIADADGIDTAEVLIAWCKIDAEGAEFPFLESPYLSALRLIEGEVHPLAPDGTEGGSDRLRSILETTHETVFPIYDTSPHFGLFTATRR